MNNEVVVMKMIGIGYGNFIAAEKVVAVVSANSKPIKYMIREARQQNVLIDATVGKRTRSAVVMANGQVVLSANAVKTILQRIENS